MMGNVLADYKRALERPAEGPFHLHMFVVPSNLCSQYVTEFLNSFAGLLTMGMWYRQEATKSRDGRRGGIYIGASVEAAWE
jgi:hypothetical protein